MTRRRCKLNNCLLNYPHKEHAPILLGLTYNLPSSKGLTKTEYRKYLVMYKNSYKAHIKKLRKQISDTKKAEKNVMRKLAKHKKSR